MVSVSLNFVTSKRRGCQGLQSSDFIQPSQDKEDLPHRPLDNGTKEHKGCVYKDFCINLILTSLYY